MKFNFTKSALTELPVTDKRTYHRDTKEQKLGLYVTPTGVKSYFAVVLVDGKTHRVPIGRFPDLSIPLARIRASDTVSQTAQTGVSPADVKRERKASEITLKEVLNTYIKEKDLKPGTVTDYRKAINETFGDWLEKPLASITEKTVLKQYQKRGQASKARADNAARVLRAIFNFSKARYKNKQGQSHFPLNPVDIIKETKTRFKIERRKRVIGVSDLPAWWGAVHALESDVARDYFLLLLMAGPRRTETAQLSWRDINLKAYTFTLTDTKNRQDVTLPLPSYVAGLLATRIQEPDELVFKLETDSPSAFDPRYAIARICKASGVDFSPHDCRRTFITIAESLDISAYTLKALVNHKTGGDVTAGYVIQTPERLQAASRRIEDRILYLAGVRSGSVVQLPVAVA